MKEEATLVETVESIVEVEAPKKIEASAKEQKELFDLVDAYCSMLIYQPGTYIPTAHNAGQYWEVMCYYKVNGLDSEDAAGITKEGNAYLFMMGDRGDETVEMTGFEYTDDGKAILTLNHYLGSERTSSVTASLIPNEYMNESMKIPFRYAIETIEIKEVK